MYFVTSEHYGYMTTGLQFFLFICILIPNIFFFLYWLYYFRIEVLKQLY